MAISLVIAFVRGWMLTLICLATFPLNIAGQYFQFQFIAGIGADTNKVLDPERTDGLDIRIRRIGATRAIITLRITISTVSYCD
jgi:hypothetical protein